MRGRPRGAWGIRLLCGVGPAGAYWLSCGSVSAELGGGYAPPHPAPTLSGKSRQKAAARRLRQKPLNAGFGRGDAQSAYFVRGLGLPWGLVLCGVRPDPRPKPAGVFACACYCRSCESGSGFRSLALRARVGVELRSGFYRYVLRVMGFSKSHPGPSGPSGAGWLSLKHHRPHFAHAMLSQKVSPQEAQPARRAASRSSLLAGTAAQASRRAFRPPAVLCAAPDARTQALRA